MSDRPTQDDQASRRPSSRRKLTLQPTGQDATSRTLQPARSILQRAYTTNQSMPDEQTAQQPLNTPTTGWQADPNELAALSARVAELASGITEEHKLALQDASEPDGSEIHDDTPHQNVESFVMADRPYLQHSTVLPLPTGGSAESVQPEPNQALAMVRSKLRQLYASEPDSADEAITSYQAGQQRSKHQQYMLDLTNSGKSLAQIQVDWHSYYANLPDDEKHQVWQEFYQVHATQQIAGHIPTDARDTNQNAASTSVLGSLNSGNLDEANTLNNVSRSQPSPHKFVKRRINKAAEPRTVADIKRQLLQNVSAGGKLQAKHHLQSLLFGVGLASMVVVLLLFGFFNERFIAPFVSPSRQVSATPIVGTSTSVGPESKIIIPKINLEVPVVYNLNTTEEDPIQTALENGVVHYSTTPTPGQNGNVVIVGHSSNNILNKGKYKFAFVLLKRLEVGDTFSLNKDGVRYTYQIYKTHIVPPTDVSVLGAADKPNSATLITCDPPGTSLNRLVVVGEQISPDPNGNKQAAIKSPSLTSSGVLPSNAPTLWQRIKNWF